MHSLKKSKKNAFQNSDRQQIKCVENLILLPSKSTLSPIMSSKQFSSVISYNKQPTVSLLHRRKREGFTTLAIRTHKFNTVDAISLYQWFLAGGHASPGEVNTFPGVR